MTRFSRRCKNTLVFSKLCSILFMVLISKIHGQNIFVTNNSSNSTSLLFGNGIDNGESIEVYSSGHVSEGSVINHEEEETHVDQAQQHGDGGESHGEGHSEGSGEGQGEGHGGHDAYSVLFPWFIQAIGLVVFFIISRFVHGLPYTALMFLIGLFMGIAIADTNLEDQLTLSTITWTDIDSEVILLVFLPGLLFRDALGVNWHLFTNGFWQIMIFAFPMVLAGTYLTALVAYHLMPFEWSWMLCLTLGSILAATDPVAVAALLNEVGAPPRLKIHIGGESMFNDGAAIVFYTIFHKMFLYELDIGLGEQVSVGGGFELFFRMAFGGAAAGIAFAIALIIVLYFLDRRLCVENNVVQVVATVTTAYLTFYISEVVWGMSGVIAVVICGITTRAYGGAFINDNKMMESFWILLEHLLNTLLFALGGVVSGEIIANASKSGNLSGIDWAYLILLYVFVMLIRFFLMFVCYPLTSRIGLGTNWQETFFISYGGLRGAVGIALAISLNNQVASRTDDIVQRQLTSSLFACVSLIAFLTLMINGPTAGPILRRLGLATASDTRKLVLKEYHRHLRNIMKKEYAMLMDNSRFSSCSHGIVVDHLVILKDMKPIEAEAACRNFGTSYRELSPEDPILPNASEAPESAEERKERKATNLIELRHLFIQLLHAGYEKQLKEGQLDERDNGGFTFTTLNNSLEFAKDDVNRGLPLNDWKYTNEVAVGRFFSSFARTPFHIIWENLRKGDRTLGRKRRVLQKKVLLMAAFVHAHKYAQKEIREGFIPDREDQAEGTIHTLKEVAEYVLAESAIQVKMAEDSLSTIPKNDLDIILAHHAVIILLNKAAQKVEQHMESGMISEKEAQHYLEEIDDAIHGTRACDRTHNSGGHSVLMENSRASYIRQGA